MYPFGVRGVNARMVELPSGMSVRVLESGPASDHGVLLIHGWGGCVYSFAETIPALAEAGHRVVALDLPGHGLSDKPVDDAIYSTRALSDTVLEAASAVGLERFALVGHSMGGALGLELGLRGESRMRRLALINAAGIGRVPLALTLRLLSPRVVNRWVPGVLGRRVVYEILRGAYGTAGRPTERDVDEYWAPTQFDEFAWACRACLHRGTWTPLSESQASSLRLPVLVIIGGRDRVVRGGSARAATIPSVRVVHVPDGGHLVQQECAGRTNEELLQFLARP